MGLWSRYKSHSQCLSHSLLKQLVTAASRDFKTESKKLKEADMTLQPELSWALWGAHRFNTGHRRTWGQLEQSRPKTWRQRGRSSWAAPYAAAEWRDEHMLYWHHWGPIHWAVAAEGPEGEESESLQLRDSLAYSLALWILQTGKKGASS